MLFVPEVSGFKPKQLVAKGGFASQARRVPFKAVNGM